MARMSEFIDMNSAHCETCCFTINKTEVDKNVYVAIAMALSENGFLNEHDEESGALTIKNHNTPWTLPLHAMQN